MKVYDCIFLDRDGTINSDPNGYINSIHKLSPLKTYKFISFPSSGGCWTPIYSSQAKDKNVDAFFIETAATEIDSTPAILSEFENRKKN